LWIVWKVLWLDLSFWMRWGHTCCWCNYWRNRVPCRSDRYHSRDHWSSGCNRRDCSCHCQAFWFLLHKMTSKAFAKFHLLYLFQNMHKG
jgi:hypothetical protein